MNKRGIVYYVWGNYNKQQLQRSIKSVEKFGYEYTVVVDKTEYVYVRKKMGIYKNSPYATTLFLDTDTIVKGNLDFGFDMADKYGLACCIAPASIAHHFAYDEKLKKVINKEIPQYNTGALFFNKEKTKKTFDLWEEWMKKCPNSSKNDQAYFAHAVFETINPYVLPKNWNYRPQTPFHGRLHGQLKILHSPTDINE